ncbi:hypothetical protein J2T17_007028 [Paenibacillus mucilaginosus]
MDRLERDSRFVNRLTNMAKNWLRNGMGIQETKKNLQLSPEYQEWIGIDRCMSVDFDKIGWYEDLLSSLELERFSEDIEGLAQLIMIDQQSTESSAGKEYNIVLGHCGYRITKYELSYELARFSGLLGHSAPIPYRAFFAIVTGHLLFDGDLIKALGTHEEIVREFLSEFNHLYRM